LTRSTNSKTTNAKVSVKKAIVAILFKDNSIIPNGDRFMTRLGIDSSNKNKDGTFRVASKGGVIETNLISRGGVKSGFEMDALISLRNILNYDHHIYRYYGSETRPPCAENV
jgi:hypothetical protein